MLDFRVFGMTPHKIRAIQNILEMNEHMYIM